MVCGPCGTILPRTMSGKRTERRSLRSETQRGQEIDAQGKEEIAGREKGNSEGKHA